MFLNADPYVFDILYYDYTNSVHTPYRQLTVKPSKIQGFGPPHLFQVETCQHLESKLNEQEGYRP
jgi:hypothetical protein